MALASGPPVGDSRSMAAAVGLGAGPGRRQSRPILATLALVLAFAGGAGACANPAPDDAAAGEVVLYTSMPDPIVDRLKGVVERQFPDLEGNYWLSPGGEGVGGISLRVVRGRTADIEERLAAEIEQGGVEADVIWLAEPSPYEGYKDMGLLARYEPPADAPIISAHADPDGFYVPGRIISMVVAWNTSLYPEGLTDWADLHDVASSAFPAPESGAARATIKALLDHHGTEYFSTLAAGGGVTVPSNGAARDGLAAGTFDAVAVLDYMARVAKASGSPIDFAYPAGGTVIIPSPIAITAGSRNPAAAEAFVDFILSRPGQEIIVEIGSFYPVRTDVEPPEGSPRLESIPAFDIDWGALAAEADEIMVTWDDVYGVG